MDWGLLMNVLICAVANADGNPRPNRLIQYFKKDCAVTFLGFNCTIEGVSFFQLTQRKQMFVKVFRILSKLLRMHKITQFCSYLCPPSLKVSNYDLIVVQDLELLPYIYQKGSAKKVLFDAREFYPKHFENKLLWGVLDEPFQRYLCNSYLPRISYGITVSEGLKKAYKLDFDFDCDVYLSLPRYQTIAPTDTTHAIKIIHHGTANPARKIEQMIYAMDGVRDGITLDLMLVGNSKYLEKLNRLVLKRKNVKIIPPVLFEDIVATLNKYDIGLIFFPNATYNLEHCMPNKLFECIQARIGVIASPLQTMKKFIEDESIGIVTKNFYAESLAEVINDLSIEKVESLKKQANCLAKKYSHEENEKLLTNIIDSMFD